MRGRQRTFVEGPVDYTDLRTEFIGLIYEGLLDYRLKRTDEQIGPQVFLNLGREPVLPLKRLEDTLRNNRNGLKNLLNTLRKETVTGSGAGVEEEEPGGDEESEEPADYQGVAEEEAVVEVEAEASGEEGLRGGDYLDAVEAAKRWAREAVVLAGLVGRQRAREPTASIRPESRPRQPGSSSEWSPPASSTSCGRATPARGPARSTPAPNWRCRPSTAHWSRSATTIRQTALPRPNRPRRSWG
jgi:hypothetical protein